VVSWRALSAIAALVLVTSCAKIFGVDDTGTLSDGGVGEPCDPNSSNPTTCGQGLVCTGGNGPGQGYRCAASCTADSQCPASQGCLAVNNTMGGGGGGSFTYVCQPNGSCNGNACGWPGTQCNAGMCRDTCSISGGSGMTGFGTCPSDETCIPMCPTCSSGVCQPNGSSGGEGGADGGSSFAPLPEALTEMACAAGMDGKIYVFGGMNMLQAPTQTTYIYDPVANKWSNGTPMSFRVYGAGVGIAQNPPGFYVVGGFGPSGAAAGANETYNPGGAPGGLWMQTPPMPTALGGSAVGGIGMFIVAGGATSVSGPAVDTVEEFQLPGQWSNQMPPTLGMARKWLAAAQSPGGGMLAIGGYDSTGHVSQRVEGFAGTAWSLGSAMPTARAKLAATTGPNSLVYAVGGFNGTMVLDTVELYQPGNGMWQPLPPMPTPREGLCLVWLTGMGLGRLYAIGGDDGASPMPDPLSTVEAFDIGSNTWIR
jgi:Kelch motif